MGSQLSQPVMEEDRISTYKINPIILNRWSPRSMTGEKLGYEELMTVFEAARWAPSSAKSQPWRLIYATRNTEEWNTLFNLLEDFNKTWARNAAVLIVVALVRDEKFDMVFLDGTKEEYFKYLKLVEKSLKKCAVVVADKGVFEKTMYDFLEYVRNSGQYESSFIETESEFNKAVKDAID